LKSLRLVLSAPAALAVVAPPALAQFTFAPPATFRPGDGAVAVAASDFDRDGRADVLILDENGSVLTFFAGDGAGGFAPGVTSATAFRGSKILLTDVDGDGVTDAGIAGAGPRQVMVARGGGAGTFTIASRTSVQGAAFCAAFRDFDGDGFIDLAAPSTDTDSVVVGRGDGSGRFSLSPPIPVGRGPHDVAAADFDGDGLLDLAVTNYYSGDVSVLQGNRLAFREVARMPASLGAGAWGIVARDFNGDGFMDIAASAYDAGHVRVFLGDGALGFTPFADLATPGRPSFIVATDFDLDGVADLAVVPYYSRPLSLFRGERDGRFSAAQVIDLPFATPSSAAAADFDGDSIPDFVVTGNDDGGDDVAVYRNLTTPRCIGGNVGAGPGQPTDVLFVNDSVGAGDDRLVSLLTFQPLTIFMASPPGETGAVPYALYAWTAAATPGAVSRLPGGAGWTCLPMPITGGSPAPAVIWNTWGFRRALGAPTRAAAPAPSIVLSIPNGPGRPARFFLQGLIRDARSPSGRAAVTNGITVDIR